MEGNGWVWSQYFKIKMKLPTWRLAWVLSLGMTIFVVFILKFVLLKKGSAFQVSMHSDVH